MPNVDKFSLDQQEHAEKLAKERPDLLKSEREHKAEEEKKKQEEEEKEKAHALELERKQ